MLERFGQVLFLIVSRDYYRNFHLSKSLKLLDSTVLQWRHTQYTLHFQPAHADLPLRLSPCNSDYQIVPLLRFCKVSLQIEAIGNGRIPHRRWLRERRGSAEFLCVGSAFSAPAALKPGSKSVHQLL